jgi:hypothetical protein
MLFAYLALKIGVEEFAPGTPCPQVCYATFYLGRLSLPPRTRSFRSSSSHKPAYRLIFLVADRDTDEGPDLATPMRIRYLVPRCARQ